MQPSGVRITAVNSYSPCCVEFVWMQSLVNQMLPLLLFFVRGPVNISVV